LYDEQASEQVSKRYDNAVKFLMGVVKGEILLVKDSGASAQSTDLAEMQNGGSVFGREKSRGFI